MATSASSGIAPATILLTITQPLVSGTLLSGVYTTVITFIGSAETVNSPQVLTITLKAVA